MLPVAVCPASSLCSLARPKSLTLGHHAFQQDISRFQVTVDNAARVHGGNSLRDTARARWPHRAGQGTSVQTRRGCHRRRIPWQKKRKPRLPAHIVNLDNIWMLDFGDRFGLDLEAVQVGRSRV